jgi:hypothetical protein
MAAQRTRLALSLHRGEEKPPFLPPFITQATRPGGVSMKVTQARTVMEIIRPPIEGLPSAPVIGMHEPITQAIELMLNNDRKQIAVAGRCGIIGYVRLEDALRFLGLR